MKPLCNFLKTILQPAAKTLRDGLKLTLTVNKTIFQKLVHALKGLIAQHFLTNLFFGFN